MRYKGPLTHTRTCTGGDSQTLPQGGHHPRSEDGEAPLQPASHALAIHEEGLGRIAARKLRIEAHLMGGG